MMPSNDSLPARDEPDQPRNVDVRRRVAAVRAGQHLVEMDRQGEIVTFSLGTPTSTQVPSGWVRS